MEKLKEFFPIKDFQVTFVSYIRENLLEIKENLLYKDSLVIYPKSLNNVLKFDEILIAEDWNAEDSIVHKNLIDTLIIKKPYLINFSRIEKLGINAKIVSVNSVLNDMSVIDKSGITFILNSGIKKSNLNKLNLNKIKRIYLLKYPYSDGGILFILKNKKDLKNKLYVLYNPLEESLNNEILRLFNFL